MKLTDYIIEFLFDKGIDRIFGLTGGGVNANNGNTSLLAILVKPGHVRKVVSTRPAALGPEVKDNHLSLQIRPREGLAVQPPSLPGKRRSRLPDQLILKLLFFLFFGVPLVRLG